MGRDYAGRPWVREVAVIGAEGASLEERLLALIAACLDDSAGRPADVLWLVSRIPTSELRFAVRVLAEEVALRTVAPAEDREVALARVRAFLLEAVAARG